MNIFGVGVGILILVSFLPRAPVFERGRKPLQFKWNIAKAATGYMT